MHVSVYFVISVLSLLEGCWNEVFFFSFLFLFLVWVCAHARAHRWKSEDKLGCHPQKYSVFLETGSLIDLEDTNRLPWLASEPQGCSCLYLCSVGLKARSQHHTCHCYLGSGHWLDSGPLGLQGKCFTDWLVPPTQPWNNIVFQDKNYFPTFCLWKLWKHAQ